MKRGFRLLALACGLVVSMSAAVAQAADPKGAAAPPMPPEMAEMMKLAQPGEHHQHLAKMIGSWKAHAKFWMTPGAPPEESDGSMTVTSALGGRFFLSDFHGIFMGQPFQGMGMDGYDNHKQKHVGTWIDSMGTMILTFEGRCSEGGKVQEMRSSFDDPASGKASYMRTVTTRKDDRTVVMESFGPGPDGKEVKMMEITYKRQ